jgi:hypothetical protein
MEKYGSDKSVRNHNYTLKYSELFEPIKSNTLRIFELGLGTNNTDVVSNMGADGKPGASLYGWAEYFNNSTIFGADIDSRILFNTDRIKTFHCDQTNPESISNLWNNPELNESFDIIVEDGLHAFSANICFFENSIHKLRGGGYYIIEDIEVKEIPLFNAKLSEYRNTYPTLIFEILTLPHQTNNIQRYGDGCNNTLLIVHKPKLV